MRTVRLDDFPSGNPGYNIAEVRQTVRRALSIFEGHGVPYIFGVTPFPMNKEDVDFLNSLVKVGQVVFHGFTHKLEHKPWSTITDTWPRGGEFDGMRETEIEMAYDFGHRFLKQVFRYNPEHFIPPFNCITQAALNVLAKKGVRYIHTCDKEWNAYGYADLDFHGMAPVISPFQTLYHDAHEVVRYLKANPDDEGQITLHWMFDQNRPGWESDYHDLCDLIREEDME